MSVCLCECVWWIFFCAIAFGKKSENFERIKIDLIICFESTAKTNRFLLLLLLFSCYICLAYALVALESIEMKFGLYWHQGVARRRWDSPIHLKGLALCPIYIFFSLILFFYLGSSCFFPRLPSYFFFPIICYIVFSLRFLFSHALFPITDFQREREREKSEKRRLKQPKMYVLYVQKKRHVIENVSHYIFLPIVFFGIDS